MNPTLRLLIAAATLSLSSSSVFSQGTSKSDGQSGLIARFSGTWKEDISKRSAESRQNLVFRAAGNNGLEELRGSELRPLVQPVDFTGKPYSIDSSVNTIAWKQLDASKFERAIFHEGKLLNTRRIQLSGDDKKLTEVVETTRPSGGKTVSTVVYQRASGEKGLVGRWKPESFTTDTPPQMTFSASGANGLAVSTTENTTQYTLTFDGKPTPVTGPAVISGMTVTAKQIDASSFETTQSREGVEIGKTIRAVSSDGKKMTVSTRNFGPNASKEPAVSVFMRQ